MIGLYVHIPFCLKKCNYCDFCSFDNLSIDLRKSYIDSLIKEIKSYKRDGKIRLQTVFFGGGTPSLLCAEEFTSVYKAIEESFDLSGLKEFTIEANPKTLTEEKLLAYRMCGANRISIGLQSIHENEMIKLGRIHNLADFESSLALARQTGFDNINVDLMYGIPEQTKESFQKTLDYVLSLGVSHISLYGLIVEENTPFGKMGNELVLPSEDNEADMYYLAAKKLSGAGFSHYEISNYAKAGFESRHNLIYWKREEYIGVGLAAHSLFEGERFATTENLSEYLSKNARQYKTAEKISENDAAYEYAMLALRLKDGFSLCEYREKFGEDFLKERKEKLEKYENLGLLEIKNGRIYLTERGFYVSNAILSDIL
jgi:oxygen-independent coproporphyrinogen-3 oxidase